MLAERIVYFGPHVGMRSARSLSSAILGAQSEEAERIAILQAKVKGLLIDPKPRCSTGIMPFGA